MTSVGLNRGSHSADLASVPHAFSDALDPNSSDFTGTLFFQGHEISDTYLGLSGVALSSSRNGIVSSLSVGGATQIERW